MGNLQGKKTATSARPADPGGGIKGDLCLAGRSKRRSGGRCEGPTNMGGDHDPGDDSGGAGEGAPGGGPGSKGSSGAAVALTHGPIAGRRQWPDA